MKVSELIELLQAESQDRLVVIKHPDRLYEAVNEVEPRSVQELQQAGFDRKFVQVDLVIIS